MLERKYLAHFIDPAFGSATPTVYTRLGKDLEELTIEMNPESTSMINILGENSTRVRGYSPQYSVSPFYADTTDALAVKIKALVNTRATGDSLSTTVVDVLIKPSDGTVVEAYREDVVVIPTSFGGDNTGVQIPFEVHYCGNRVSGTFDLTTKQFTPA